MPVIYSSSRLGASRLAPSTCSYNDWARLARGKTPEGEEPPWSARNFVPYWSQVISSAAQRAAAAEILSRVREEVATRNAMSMRGA